MIRIQSYRGAKSVSARNISKRCGILLATPRQVRKYGDFEHIINWGSSEDKFNGQYLNSPHAVAVACNKLDTAERFREAGVPQPDYTTNREVAQEWLTNGHTVVERHLLRANSGRGIVVATPDGAGVLTRAPLYTKYIRKSTEFRVHVCRGQVIDYQEKKRRHDVPDDNVNWQIRNWGNGFCYARSDVELPEIVSSASVLAVSALGLDFGAVDIGYNARRNKCRVYEVNTAPGVEGSTLDSYYEAFAAIYPQIRGGRYATRRTT